MVRTHFRGLNSFLSALAGVCRLPQSETGATAVEYALLVAFIASVIIAVVTVLGIQLEPGFQAAIDGF